MAQKQKRIPKELIEAVGREQATQIMNQVRKLEAGKIDHFPIIIQSEKMDKAKDAIRQISDKITVGEEYFITDYEDTGRNTFTVSRKEKPKKKNEFTEVKGGDRELEKILPKLITEEEMNRMPLDLKLRKKFSGMKISKKLAKTLDFMMPTFTEHAEAVLENKRITTTLQFDTKKEAEEARKVLGATGMLGKVSRKGDVILLEHTPEKTIRGRFGTEIDASYS